MFLRVTKQFCHCNTCVFCPKLLKKILLLLWQPKVAESYTKQDAVASNFLRLKGDNAIKIQPQTFFTYFIMVWPEGTRAFISEKMASLTAGGNHAHDSWNFLLFCRDYWITTKCISFNFEYFYIYHYVSWERFAHCRSSSSFLCPFICRPNLSSVASPAPIFAWARFYSLFTLHIYYYTKFQTL